MLIVLLDNDCSTEYHFLLNPLMLHCSTNRLKAAAEHTEEAVNRLSHHSALNNLAVLAAVSSYRLMICLDKTSVSLEELDAIIMYNKCLRFNVYDNYFYRRLILDGLLFKAKLVFVS